MTQPPGRSGSWVNPNHRASEAATRMAESLTRGEQLRAKMRQGLALGTFLIELPTRNTLSAIALGGFDFVVIDMEHSSIDFAQLEMLVGAGNAAGLVTLVRPWSTDAGLIGKILDCGAHGIMAPHVDSPERARDVVAQARFAPRGSRGFSPLAKYDALATPLSTLSDSTVVVVQIEGRDGLSRVKEIAAVEGIDAVFIGPYDLSLSLDVPPGSPAVFAAAEDMAKAVPSSVNLGLYVDDPTHSAKWAGLRFSLQCVSFDGRMLADAARDVVSRARSGK
jgi:2-keto-3-deoxy-L-rhamnonate aldolase RhmA